MYPFQYQQAQQCLFGEGSVGLLAKKTPLKKAERVLVVSDQGVSAAGITGQVVDALGDKVVHIDTDAVPDARASHIERLAARAKALDVDAVVAVGGGSVIDTAKLCAALMAKGGSASELDGMGTVRARLLPMVAVPTTSGTGAECTQFVVVLDDTAEVKKKLIVVDPSVVPACTVLDPTLTAGLPDAVTAHSGVDALTHAVEALGSKISNPFGAAFALEAIDTIVSRRALIRAIDDNSDMTARAEMLTAAHLAGQAINTSMLGACHAFAHSIGAVTGLPHGLANGICLVATMRFNLPRAATAYARIGRVLGVVGDNPEALAHGAIERIDHYVHDVVKIPRRMAALGVTADKVAPIAEGALLDPDWATNPMKKMNVDDAQAFVQDLL